jgi:enoyl-CoA hydratase
VGNAVAANDPPGVALAHERRVAVKLGLSAGESGISWHLPRLIGMPCAMEIMLTGRTVGGEEAAALGLGRLADDALSAAPQTAHAILANSPSAVKLTMEIAWTNLDANFDRAMELEADTQHRASRTRDFREAIATFSEKGSPVFTDRKLLRWRQAMPLRELACTAVLLFQMNGRRR